MKLAHARELNSPTGAPWRLMAALDRGGRTWLDLEAARASLVRADSRLVHNQVLYRRPVTTLDEHLRLGLRVAALSEIVERHADGAADTVAVDDAVRDAAQLRFGPPVLQPTSLRDFYAFEEHVAAMWRRRGEEIPAAWYSMPIFYFGNVSEIRGPHEPVWAPLGCAELDYELEVAALIDTPAANLPPDRGEEAIGGYLVLNDWSARDLQREETTVRLGPAKGKDFATSIGPWLVTPDELADRRAGKGYDLAMEAWVGDRRTSEGRWSSAAFSFGEMVARASADVRLRPGDLLGSGTVGGGCLLEIREQRLGRWLEPGDVVKLQIERMGILETPIVERPVDGGPR
jgi:fumarylacetoacetate (FAA) hydrolase